MIFFDKFPEGRKKALTMSYDDGTIFDKKLIDIFNKNKIKGTFHINSGLIEGNERKIQLDEIKDVYSGHEVAVHGVKHQTLTKIPLQSIMAEILEDRRMLEKIVGYPILGMSYANGAFSDEVCAALSSCGIVYSRTTQSTKSWGIPENFLKWHPTCHHNNAMETAERFINYKYSGGHLLYIWGHSYEFDTDNNWDMMEKLCALLGNRDDIWYATNIEVYNYIKALKSLIISVDEDIIINPTMYELWFAKNGEDIKINPMQTLKL